MFVFLVNHPIKMNRLCLFFIYLKKKWGKKSLIHIHINNGKLFLCVSAKHIKILRMILEVSDAVQQISWWELALCGTMTKSLQGFKKKKTPTAEVQHLSSTAENICGQRMWRCSSCRAHAARLLKRERAASHVSSSSSSVRIFVLWLCFYFFTFLCSFCSGSHTSHIQHVLKHPFLFSSGSKNMVEKVSKISYWFDWTDNPFLFLK